MSRLPSLVTTLKYLRDNPVWAQLNDVITATGESSTRVEKALGKLVDKGLITRQGTRFRYVADSKTEALARNLLGLYGKIIREPQLELTLRGIMATIGYPSSYLRCQRLVAVLGREQFGAGEVVTLLEREVSKGYIEKINVIFTRNRPGSASAMAYQLPSGSAKWVRIIPIARVPYPPPLKIATFYMSNSRDVMMADLQRLREEYYSTNPGGVEEEYVLGIYPAELAEPAFKFVNNERMAMIEALKEETYQEWFGLRYIW
jgi:hypothetical protein